MHNHTFAFNKDEDWSVSTTRISVILSNDTEQLTLPMHHVKILNTQYTAHQQITHSSHEWNNSQFAMSHHSDYCRQKTS